MIIPFLVFTISLGSLLFSSKLFTETAEKIGIYFKIPPFIIGVVILGIGTSLPELATALSAVYQGHSEIVIGNVVGANIANILFVLSITAIVGKQLLVDKEVINIDLPILLSSVILLYLTTLDGTFTKMDGTISLSIILTYIIYNIHTERELTTPETKILKTLKKEEKNEEKQNPVLIRYFLLLIVTSGLLYLSSNYTVESILAISEILGISSEILAITIVSIGTTLPELTVSIIAALKGNADIAIGNVTGSNIFNTLAVMGIASMAGAINIPIQIIAFTIPTLILITILYMFVIIDKQITRWEGITLLFLYIAFISKSIGLL